MTKDTPMCQPHDPSLAFLNTVCNAFSISFRCWESPSFIINCARCLTERGISLGIACSNTQQKLNCCSFGIHIHKKTTCFLTEVQHENVKRLNPLLLEWEVTSHQITSGHNINSLKAGARVHAMAMNNTCVGLSCHSSLSFWAFFWSDVKDTFWSFSWIGSFFPFPYLFHVVCMVIVLDAPDSLFYLHDWRYLLMGTSDRVVKLISLQFSKSSNTFAMSSEAWSDLLNFWNR